MKILIIIILPVIYTYKARKRIKKSQNKVKENWNKIDELLKVRNDIIPELIDVTKKYINRDDILNSISNARKDLLISRDYQEKMENSNKLTSELGYLFSITEDYVNLKENGNFIDIQNKIHDTEDQISKSKKIYNISVTDYKKKTNGFPSKIIAYVFKFKPAIVFEEAKKIEPQKPEIEEVEVLEL